MAESRDPLRNGAIFRVKDLSLLRGSRNLGISTHPPIPSDASERAMPLDNLPSIIRSRFDELYRATPMPTFGPFQNLHSVKIAETTEKTPLETAQYVFPYPTLTNRRPVPEARDGPPEIRRSSGDTPVGGPRRAEPEPGAANTPESGLNLRLDSPKPGHIPTPSPGIIGSKRRLRAERRDPTPSSHSLLPKALAEATMETTDLPPPETAGSSPVRETVSAQSPLSDICDSKSPSAAPVSNKRSRMRMQDSSLLSLLDKSRLDSSPAHPLPNSSEAYTAGAMEVVRVGELPNSTNPYPRQGRNDTKEGPSNSKKLAKEKSRQKKASPPLEKRLSWTADEDKLLREAHRTTRINASMEEPQL